MSRLSTLVPLLAALPLAGCFISETPIIGPEEADFPYRSITYKEPGKDGQSHTMTQAGDSYVMLSPDGTDRVDLRFRDIGDDLYLAQMTSEEPGRTTILYSVLKLDRAKKTAESYVAVARPDEEERPGLRRCRDSMLCIDDTEAYIALAREAVADGPPDVTYEIVALE